MTTVTKVMEYLPKYISVAYCYPTNNPQNLVAKNNNFLLVTALWVDWTQLESFSATCDVD